LHPSKSFWYATCQGKLVHIMTCDPLAVEALFLGFAWAKLSANSAPVAPTLKRQESEQ